MREVGGLGSAVGGQKQTGHKLKPRGHGAPQHHQVIFIQEPQASVLSAASCCHAVACNPMTLRPMGISSSRVSSTSPLIHLT
ncbi:hypothetical protein EYF80_012291 [Liparis tanakae]|uniref:Uncharacterized protein n=1 Tax=Liparis tanakae TaxID=230148 RepID=A0A4Z2II77_9TELE|nr:hypothetical protein EYF80_012291 [Liparis tanakae]